MYAKPMNLQDKLIMWIDSQYPEAAKETELFGIEVELEGKGGISLMSPAVHQFWLAHNDGSLRKMAPGDEAIEYVTKRPYGRIETVQAVKTLMDFLNQPQLQVYESYRTSIHVHVNCLADTQLHIFNFVTLCLLFDELFVSQNGDHRVGNNFCLRAKDAQGQVVDLVRSIESHGNLFGIGNNNRYSSINFASLTKFGTVEFRSLECTTDILRIMHWIRTIDYLKQASRTFVNPHDIIQKFSQWSSEEFVLKVLGPQAGKYLKVPGYNDMLFNGMRIAQEFAFCSKWINMPEKKQQEPKVKKNLHIGDPALHQAWAQVQVAAAGGGAAGQWVGVNHVAPGGHPAWGDPEPVPQPDDFDMMDDHDDEEEDMHDPDLDDDF